MKFMKVIVSALVLIGTCSAYAQKKQSLHDQFTGQGYGMAGCGLGSVVFGDKPGMIQIFAGTTNNVGYQTFAISSGTSNCGESGKSAMGSQFIETNKVALQNDLARGQGETLAALSQVLECKNQNFGDAFANSYKSSFPQGGASVSEMETLANQACSI